MTVGTVADRTDLRRQVVTELEEWRASVVPLDAPLDADDLARLVRSCYSALGIEAAVGADFSVNTVHYYRRKDILDAPAGRTSAARYGVRHLWQAAGARLAGYLGLVTLAEARKVMRGADEQTLVEFVAARVVDARARQHVRSTLPVQANGVQARPLPGVHATSPRPILPIAIPLPGEAWCVLPASHPAHQSTAAARELIDALAAALNVNNR